MRNYLVIPQNIKDTITNDPAILFLGLYTNQVKTFTQTNTYKRMLTVALLTKAKRWKETKFPPTDEWINKLWYTHAMEYCSAIRIKVSDMLQPR